MTAQIIPFGRDARSSEVAVSRSALSAATENALASSKSIADAVDRAMNAAWSGDRATVIRTLERIGFEASERNDALAALTNLAEQAPSLTWEDGAAVPLGSAGAA
jgi:S-adenosylhomocysteine hydrolase